MATPASLPMKCIAPSRRSFWTLWPNRAFHGKPFSPPAGPFQRRITGRKRGMVGRPTGTRRTVSYVRFHRFPRRHASRRVSMRHARVRAPRLDWLESEKATNIMALTGGTRLGPYQIVEPIGAGGMGGGG